MRMNLAFLFLLFALLISSCEKDFIVDQHGANNKMAVNSLFNDGNPIQVFITKPYAVGVPNTAITFIPDARVELYEDNVFKEALHYTPADSQNVFGYYLSSLTPQQGKTYTIKATNAKYLDATATDQIPVGAQIVASSLQQYVDTGNNAKGIMTMMFNDDPAVQNYYRINVWAYGEHWSLNQQGDTVYDFESSGLETFPLSPLSDTVRDGYFFLFSDAGFNGQQKSLQISFATIETSHFSNLTLYVELHTVSKAHYQYFQTLNLYRSTNGSSEPVFIDGNVNNGFGAFVGEHWETMPFVIK